MVVYEYQFFIEFEKGSGRYRLDGPYTVSPKLANRYLTHLRKQIRGTKIKITSERRTVTKWKPVK